MNILFLDFETYSEHDIRKTGSYKYLEDFEGLLCAYALDDEVVQVWDIVESKGGMPEDLQRYLEDPNIVCCAHNSTFDRVVLQNLFGITNKKWIDTAVIARQHSLPFSLAQLCQAFKLPGDQAKEKDGKKLIQIFSKPQPTSRKVSRHTAKTKPEDWKRFIHYAYMDVESMRTLYKKLPKWNCTKSEYDIWQLDQKINDSGFCVDIELAKQALKALYIQRDELNKRCQELTGGKVESLSQTKELTLFLANINPEITNLRKDTIQKFLSDLPKESIEAQLLDLRACYNKTSVAKYQSVLDSACKDSHVRGTQLYCGAGRTARWAGRGLQPQNLPLPIDNMEKHIDIIKTGYGNLVYGSDLPEVCAGVLRGLIIAAPGHKLIVADYSSIEGVGLAWVAGEAWKIQAYNEIFQGIGYDMYIRTYAATFSIPEDQVTKDMRAMGKILELAMGYGGGIGSFISFAKSFCLDLQKLSDSFYTESPCQQEAIYYYEKGGKDLYPDLPKDIFITCDTIKRLWRQANPHISGFWGIIEKAVRTALRSNQADYQETIALPYCKLQIARVKSWLLIRLPSGRYLSYPAARISDVDGKIIYKGLDAITHAWTDIITYGGKLTENIVQALCRDILAHGMLQAEKHGYKIVLTVHDEIVSEVPDTSEFTVEKMIQYITYLPSWVVGLPVKATGFEGYRYRK